MSLALSLAYSLAHMSLTHVTRSFTHARARTHTPSGPDPPSAWVEALKKKDEAPVAEPRDKKSGDKTTVKKEVGTTVKKEVRI